MLAREPVSVWDRLASSPRDRGRWLTVAAGAAFTMMGARKGGLGGAMLGGIGATLAVRAAMGRHDAAMAQHVVKRLLSTHGSARDVVQSASDESFPASDSPSWTPMEGTGRR